MLVTPLAVTMQITVQPVQSMLIMHVPVHQLSIDLLVNSFTKFTKVVLHSTLEMNSIALVWI